MTFRNALVLAGIALVPLAASAQPVDGLYIAGGAGANYREDQDVRAFGFGAGTGGLGGVSAGFLPNNETAGTGLKLRSDIGFVGLGSIGYGFGNGFRIELEGDYRQNRLRALEGSPFPAAAGGQAETYGGFVNVFYDFSPALFGLTDFDFVQPYIGAGVGYGETELNGGKVYSGYGDFYLSTNDKDGNVAVQGIAGLAFPIAAVPGLALTAEYRFYTQLGDTTFNGFAITPAVAPAVGGVENATRIKLGDQYNHAGLVGFRYAFNQPAPPPPPPPPPPAEPPVQPTKSYLVFFDWDKATLTERARQIIHEAADNSTHVQYTRIEVNGYTDTSGTPKYNQGLSVRRAQAVAAELVRDGVPRQSISIQGFGETHLLVPTGPGVREPQNRRVEIIIQ